MVSFQTPFPELNHRKMVSESDESNSKKRKWNDDSTDHAEDILPCKLWRNPKGPATAPVAASKPFSDIDLHLETPLPSEWQRCLDIQSGEIHFYNTRTQKRTLRDPRESPEASSPRDRQTHMSLDLELNLPCGSLNNNSSLTSEKTGHNYNNMMVKKPSNSSFPPATADLFMSLSTNGSGDDEAEEMVATACMRCHMLVMLCKSSPTCPNCKFMHPPYHSPPDLFKPRLSLSC